MLVKRRKNEKELGPDHKKLFGNISGKILTMVLRYEPNTKIAEALLEDIFKKNISVRVEKYWTLDSEIIPEEMKKEVVSWLLASWFKNEIGAVLNYQTNKMQEVGNEESDYSKFSNEQLIDSLQTLENTERVVFNAVAIDALSKDEIANILSTNTGTIENILHNARVQIASYLAETLAS